MKKIKTSKFSVLFIILVLILLSISIVLILKTSKGITPSEKLPFKVDQLLVKVLIKSNESFKSPLNIMDISDKEIPITLEPKYLSDIASLSENSFTLKPGQTKTVYIDFRSLIEEKNIAHAPGAYIGALLVGSDTSSILIPMIVEVETKEVLFDTNLEISAKGKEIPLGSYSNVQVALFNLKRIGLTNVGMDYFVKDIMGNIIMTESETVVVETQATFTKTIDIPKNLNPGNYVFVAQARYGDSIGISTLLFKVPQPEEKEKPIFGLERYCKTYYCWTGLIVLIISILTLIIYGYFYIGSFLYDKILGLKKKEIKEVPKEKEEIEITTKKISPPPPIEKELPKKEIKEEIKVIKKELPKKKPEPKKEIKKIDKKIKKPKRISKKDLEKEKLKEKLKEWKAKGYDTKLLEEELKKPKKETKKEIINKIKEWKAKGYDTKSLEEKLKKLK